MLALMKRYNNREDGFTLIELLIVVLIIGILAAVSIPVYLGIQNSAHKSAVKADVNVAVKQVQLGLTEGVSISSLYGTKNGSDKNETVQVKASTTTGASANDFMVIGTETSPVSYTYSYDSVTGQFTDSDATAFGGVNQANVAPTITSGVLPATGTVGTAYTFAVTATGTPAPTYSATGLPTGVIINATTGVISGAPTAANTYNYTITATNGTSPDATQTGTITTTAPPAPVINTVALPDVVDSAGTVTTVPIDVTGSPTLSWSGLPSCVTVSGATLKYSASCATQSFTSATPTLTATNGGGTVTRQYYLLEKFSSSTYQYNNDFTSTGASDFTVTGGTVANATAPDGRQALAVTETGTTTKLTQTTGTVTPSGGAIYQYGVYFYLPASTTATMCIYFNNSSEYCASTVSTSGGWYPVTAGLSAGSSGAAVQTRFSFTGAAGKTIYVSNARNIKL